MNTIAQARIQASRTAGLLECKRLAAEQQDLLKRAIALTEASATPGRGSEPIEAASAALYGVINRLTDVHEELCAMSREDRERERQGS